MRRRTSRRTRSTRRRPDRGASPSDRSARSSGECASIDTDLTWEEGDVPYSERFGDVYFSAEDGLAETRHVFLDGNNLPAAWAGRRDFTVGETGFGTGLNFCATVDLWQKTRPNGALLHYVSIEGFPLGADACLKALARWPELAGISELLCRRYPAPTPGFHRVHFEEWGILLTLVIGEAGAVLPEICGQIDAWFLDGFAPSRNPEMWREAVLQGIARLTAPGGSLATFTSAGAVRRGLGAAGFEVRKVPGFGRKREMSVARMREDLPDEETMKPRISGIAAPVIEARRDANIAIIGGGIAGASLARALRRRGVAPTIFDKEGLGAGASGNPFALVMPRMDAGESAAARFFAAAYRFAVRDYARSSAWDPSGVLVLLADEKAQDRARKGRERSWNPAHEAEFLPAEAATERAGLPVECPALFHPGAGLLETKRLLADWTEGCPVREAIVGNIRREGDGATLLLDGAEEELGRFDRVILAAGAGNAVLDPATWLPLAPVRGQLSILPPNDRSADLRCALSWGGYLSPVRDGVQMLGATHDPFNRIGEAWESAVLAADHERNREALPDAFKEILPSVSERWQGRASLRAVTPDRVPLFGAVPEGETLAQLFAARPRVGNLSLPSGDILVLGGLGSRGYVTAPLAAEILVARLFGEVWVDATSVVAAGDPCRFPTRDYRHGRIRGGVPE